VPAVPLPTASAEEIGIPTVQLAVDSDDGITLHRLVNDADADYVEAPIETNSYSGVVYLNSLDRS
jgi:hypothetical protein